MLKSDNGLPAKVAHQLLQRIIAKEFPPGGVLPSEREIGETYSVSRPVAREAIKLLAARGIVAVHPRQGATIGLNLTGAASEALLLAFHHENVVHEDLLNARLVLEPHIVGLSAQYATSMQLRRLAQLRDKLLEMLHNIEVNHVDEAFQLWSQHDAQFHILLAEMCQNPVFKVLIEVVVGILWKQRHDEPLMTVEHLRGAATQHIAIADAIMQRDSKQAEQAMLTHLEFTRTHIFSRHNGLQKPVRLMLEQSNKE